MIIGTSTSLIPRRRGGRPGLLPKHGWPQSRRRLPSRSAPVSCPGCSHGRQLLSYTRVTRRLHLPRARPGANLGVASPGPTIEVGKRGRSAPPCSSWPPGPGARALRRAAPPIRSRACPVRERAARGAARRPPLWKRSIDVTSTSSSRRLRDTSDRPPTTPGMQSGPDASRSVTNHASWYSKVAPPE